MASLSLSHFLSFPSLFPRRHYCYRQLQQPPHDLCRFRASSINKSRGKVKTNAELCDDIREFVTANGLPEGYVPTMKEFSELGRSDLAYIVRRRGYKLVGELLGNTDETDSSGSNVEKSVAEDKGQYENPGNIMVERSTSFGAAIDSDDNLDTGENEDRFLVTKLSVIENHVDSSDVGLPFDSSSNHSQEIPTEADSMEDGRARVEASNDLASADIGPELTTEASSNLSVDSPQNGLHENMDMIEEVVALSSKFFINNPLPGSANVDQTHLSSTSLEDEVANFMRNGDLDTIEESDSDGMLKEIDEEEEVQAVNSSTSANSENAYTKFNWNTSNSTQVDTTENHPLRDANLSDEGQNIQFKEDPDDKTNKRDNSAEINHLKFMLHEKELELSRLKEQIEKEKRSLSLLQAKAETEISKAQKLITEKDAELLAAEEMLSELVEVQIRYHGDGEIVEVAGSFNGWHHWIKMDPESSLSITDPVESRKSKIWSTMLWLYPGIYEIKFIVDGEWKIDPRMESVSNGTISNNILRVHR